MAERARAKHLEYTKHILIERRIVKPDSIKIKWAQDKVEVDNVPIAWWNPAGEFQMTGVAAQIKGEVDEMVKQFTIKRGDGVAGI